MNETKKNLAWLILTRLVVISLFLATITYFNYQQPNLFTDEMLRGVTRLIIVTYCFSILSLTAFGLSSRFLTALAYAQIIWEILFVSTLVVLTGGIKSNYAFFYNLAIINASFLFARREAFYTASLCGIIYGALIDFHFYGRLERFGLYHEVDDFYNSNYIFLLIITNLLAFFLTAILTGYLAERARKSESALRKKEIDYEELERLNSMIVSTLDSGLITVNSSGCIRVFNRTASELTGFAQVEAYDKQLQEIFPEAVSFSNLLSCSHKEEIIFKDKFGKRSIFAIKSAPFTDKEGNRTGAVIDFQDVTRIREMESQLKRADRLAAIGELSARIAHEVRNPLASISGSVQLISQSDAIQKQDKKLIEIVIRETERLDKLLQDFLQYARPKPPERNWFSLNQLIQELTQLLRGDRRFTRIDLDCSIQDNMSIFADHDQIRQVILNLLLNAAEASPEGGSVKLECKFIDHKLFNNSTDCNLELSVSDCGNGISENNLKHIFEPFFTTKSGGSGLGLATVYRIIEAHGGSITVENRSSGGSFFRFNLPVPNITAKDNV